MATLAETTTKNICENEIIREMLEHKFGEIEVKEFGFYVVKVKGVWFDETK